VKILLEIEATKNSGQPSVTVHLTFTNDTKKPIKIVNFLTGNGQSPSNAFFQVSANGAKIGYIGEMAKRGEPTENEFKVLKTKQELKGSFDLSSSYRWLQNITEYSIFYESFNHFSPDEILLKSDIFKFRF
jgi:hypothetical protein